MKNEVKVGILGIATVLLLFWGYNFLKGKNVLSSALVLKAHFKSVVGLNIAAPVLINGFKVGAVTSIYQDDKYDGTIVAELTIEEKVQLPKNTVASIITPSLMSGSAISLEFKGTCQGGDCLTSGTVIAGRMGGLTMVEDAMGTLRPYLDKADTLMSSVRGIAENPEGDFKKALDDMKATVANLRTITELLGVLLNSTTNSLSGTMANVQSITANVKNSNEEITAVLKNLRSLSEDLKKLELAETAGDARQVFDKLGKTLDEAQTMVVKANKAVDNVVQATNLSQQEGLVAALLYDKVLKQDVAMMIKDIDLLVKDIRLHPERYRTVLSGKKKPYISPEEEEARKRRKKG